MRFPGVQSFRAAEYLALLSPLHSSTCHQSRSGGNCYSIRWSERLDLFLQEFVTFI